MSSIPSLKGLQAFEAAARLGSFAAAAAELSVSPAAVSQSIRGLEDQLGRKLFHRIKRRVTLTEAGLEILPRVTAAFDDLRSVAAQLEGSGPRARLTISVPPSAATGWLAGRVKDFLAAQGPLDLALRGEEDPVPFARERIDLRLSYGRLQDHPSDCVELLQDAVYPVCTPSFLADHGPFAKAEALLGAPLIHTDWGPAAARFPSWRDWSPSSAETPQVAHGLLANSSKAALDLAASGLGLALCQGLFVAAPLAEGRLVKAFPRALPLPQPYCLTIPARRAEKPLVSAFKAWFLAEIEDAVASAADSV